MISGNTIRGGELVRKKQNHGMTMVEVVVAFTALAVIMGILYSCIMLSSNFARETADLDRDNEEFGKAVTDYFRDGDYVLGGSDSVTLTFHEVREDGMPGTDYDLQVYRTSLSFEMIGGSYRVSGTDTGQIRKLYLFSTGNP